MCVCFERRAWVGLVWSRLRWVLRSLTPCLCIYGVMAAFLPLCLLLRGRIRGAVLACREGLVGVLVFDWCWSFVWGSGRCCCCVWWLCFVAACIVMQSPEAFVRISIPLFREEGVVDNVDSWLGVDHICGTGVKILWRKWTDAIMILSTYGRRKRCRPPVLFEKGGLGFTGKRTSYRYESAHHARSATVLHVELLMYIHLQMHHDERKPA